MEYGYAVALYIQKPLNTAFCISLQWIAVEQYIQHMYQYGSKRVKSV